MASDKSTPLADVLQFRKVLVKRMWSVPLPNYFPTRSNLTDLLECIRQEMPDDWGMTPEHFVANAALSAMLIDYRAAVAAQAEKVATAKRTSLDSTSVTEAIQEIDWAKYFPMGAGRRDPVRAKARKRAELEVLVAGASDRLSQQEQETLRAMMSKLLA